MEATVYFVIPCYNEEAVLPETTRRMTDKLNAHAGRRPYRREEPHPLCG